MRPPCLIWAYAGRRRSWAIEPSDQVKAIDAFGLPGGNILPLVTDSGDRFIGWSRYAEIEGDKLEPIACLPGRNRALRAGRSEMALCTNIGTLAGKMWAELGSPGLGNLIDRAIRGAGIPVAAERWPGLPEGVRIDTPRAEEGIAIVLTNHTDSRVGFSLICQEELRGVFTGEL